MTRDPVDFTAAIEPCYREIHARLENWALSLNSPSGSSASPMFRLYRADNWERAYLPLQAVDVHDAHRIDKGVHALPLANRVAVQWFYVGHTNPRRVCRTICCTMRGLDDLVRASRAMLVNRRV